MFLELINFYQRLIEGFSKMAVSFFLILKMTRLFKLYTLIAIEANDNKVIGGTNSNLELNLSKFKKTKMNKSKNLPKSKNFANWFKYQNAVVNVKIIKFLTFKASITITQLK